MRELIAKLLLCWRRQGVVGLVSPKFNCHKGERILIGNIVITKYLLNGGLGSYITMKLR